MKSKIAFTSFSQDLYLLRTPFTISNLVAYITERLELGIPTPTIYNIYPAIYNIYPTIYIQYLSYNIQYIFLQYTIHILQYSYSIYLTIYIQYLSYNIHTIFILKYTYNIYPTIYIQYLTYNIHTRCPNKHGDYQANSREFLLRISALCLLEYFLCEG